MKISIVTSGQYSDYHVCGVFSSSEKADKFKANFPKVDWNVDLKVEVDREPIAPLAGHQIFNIEMLKSGDVVDTDTLDLDLSSAENAYNHTGNFRDWYWKDRQRIDLPKRDVLVVIVWGKDLQHAVKVVNEIRTRLIATDTWAKYADLEECWKEALQ